MTSFCLIDNSGSFVATEYEKAGLSSNDNRADPYLAPAVACFIIGSGGWAVKSLSCPCDIFWSSFPSVTSGVDRLSNIRSVFSCEALVLGIPGCLEKRERFGFDLIFIYQFIFYILYLKFLYI